MYSVESIDAPPPEPREGLAAEVARDDASAEPSVDGKSGPDAEARSEPWEPPTEPILEGVDGAAQLLAQGRASEALEHLESVDLSSIDSQSPRWFQAHAIAGRASLAAGEPELAVESLQALTSEKKLRKHFPPELIGFELARARLAWADALEQSGERSRADEQRSLASKRIAVELKSKPNRLAHAMRVEQARALAAVDGSDEGKSRYWAANKASKALERVIRDYPNHPEIGALRLELALAHSRAKKYELAADELRRIHIERAGEPESEAAWKALEELAEDNRKVDLKPLRTSEKLEKATHARSLRRVRLSREILDEMIEDDSVADSTRRKARRSRSWTAYKQRDFQTCAEDLRQIYEQVPSIENRDNLSRCLERGGMYDEAIDLWLAFSKKKSPGIASSALWNAIELAMRGGEYERADELLKKYRKKYKSKREERRWFEAWVAYRLNDDERAIEGFAEVEKRDSSRRTTARYFRGKLLLNSADPGSRLEGRELLMELVDQGDREITATGARGGWPIYYGLMARQRLLDAGEAVPEAPKLEPMEEQVFGFLETARMLESMREKYGEASLSLTRAEQLHGAGWIDEARRELRVAADEYINSRKKMQGRNVRTGRTEAHVAGLGWRPEWNTPTPYMGSEGRKILRDEERSEEMREGLRTLSVALDEPNRAAKLSRYGEQPYRARWHPRPYRRAIEREAHARQVEATHLWSLMYTESRFRRHVVSHVGARGALQIMPWTARQLQERLGEFEGRLDTDILYDIDSNAHLATYYVSELMNKFHGQAPMAYASYNGGPSNVARWLAAKSKGARPLGLDDFVEEIPFRETHRYTRRVMEVQAVYSLMYSGELPRWTNEVDAKFEDNIDF
jgi:soluble lytic murein transglycosylase